MSSGCSPGSLHVNSIVLPDTRPDRSRTVGISLFPDTLTSTRVAVSASAATSTAQTDTARIRPRDHRGLGCGEPLCALPLSRPAVPVGARVMVCPADWRRLLRFPDGSTDTTPL